MNTQQTNAEMGGKNIHSKIVVIVAVLVIAVAAILFFLLRGTPATDIVFYSDNIELKPGDTQKIKYEIFPDNVTNKTVEWQSSNPSVAKVTESGEVIAISEGESVIMVTTANGKIDECLVTVKPTAFDFLKKLSNSTDGYTVGNYRTSDGSTIDIGFYYNYTENAIYVMDIYNGRNSATLVIPSSLTGDYSGYMERSYSSKTVRTLYAIDASTLTADTDIKSYYSDSTMSWDITDNDAVYTANVRAMLSTLYRELLEPNGYTHADLGFNSYV